MKYVLIGLFIIGGIVGAQNKYIPNYNVIDDIILNKNTVCFETSEYTHHYDRNEKTFKLISKNKTPTSIKKIGYDEALVPRKYSYAAYIGVSDTVSNNNETTFLFSCGSEGCYGYSGIGDTINKKFYYYDAGARCINFDENNIWIGKSNGIGILDKNTDTVEEYLALPYFTDKSKYFETEKSVFIINDGFGFQIVNKSTSSIEYKSLGDIFKDSQIKTDLGHRKDPFQFPVYSNIVKNKGSFYVGCTLLLLGGMNTPITPYSYIIKIDDNNSFSVYEIDLKGMSYISKSNDKIVIYCGLSEDNEGESPTHYGGVFCGSFGNNFSDLVQLIPKQQLVVDFVETYEGIEITTFQRIDEWGEPSLIRTYLQHEDIIESIKTDSTKYGSGMSERFKFLIESSNQDSALFEYVFNLEPSVSKIGEKHLDVRLVKK